MKKFYFLFALMATVASTCFAQSKTPRTAFADGFYYGRPAGTLYRAWNEAGSGVGPIYVCLPAFTQAEITPTVNTTSGDSVKWEYRYIYSADSARVVDVTDNIDSVSGKFIVEALTPKHYVAAPTMVQDTSEFVLGQASAYISKNVIYYTRISPMDKVLPLSFFDDHTNVKSNSAFGSLDTHYLLGSGTYKDTMTAVAVRQEYEAPIAPLYVENIWLKYISFSDTPIPEDKELSICIYNTDTKETYATLTANASDIVQKAQNTSTTYGIYYTGYISFYQKIETMFGDLANEPFVIDGPMTVQINGLDQEGISIGFYGYQNPDEDPLKSAKQLIQTPDGKTLKSFTYKNCAMGLYFNAMFDAVKVYDEEGANVLTVEETGAVTDTAYVFTATPWFGYDDEGNIIAQSDDADPIYFIEEDSIPSWITAIEIVDTLWNDHYYTELVFTCEPLPEGVDSRSVELYVEGRGVVSSTPIVLTQTAAEQPDAIRLVNDERNTKAVGTNLMGIKVNDSYKGIVIKNGKKVYNN